MGNLLAGNVLNGGVNNASGSQLSVLTAGRAVTGSLVNRSTSSANLGGAFASDTGTGSSGGLLTGGYFSFLANSVVQADASNGVAANTAGIDLLLEEGADLLAQFLALGRELDRIEMESVSHLVPSRSLS